MSTAESHDSETPKTKSQKAEAPPAAAAADPVPALVVFSMDTATGKVVGVETVDRGGARHEPSGAEWEGLAGVRAQPTVEAIFEDVFEAGINYVLGAVAEDETPGQPDEADLRHLILQRLIKDSAALRLMSAEVLRRAILASLVREAADGRAAAQAVTH
jgi:hypothetical protein